MVKQIILALFIIASFYGYYGLLVDSEPEFLSYVTCVILAGFEILGSIYLYKDIKGWDKFEYEGFRLKKKVVK